MQAVLAHLAEHFLQAFAQGLLQFLQRPGGLGAGAAAHLLLESLVHQLLLAAFQFAELLQRLVSGALLRVQRRGGELQVFQNLVEFGEQLPRLVEGAHGAQLADALEHVVDLPGVDELAAGIPRRRALGGAFLRPFLEILRQKGAELVQQFLNLPLRRAFGQGALQGFARGAQAFFQVGQLAAFGAQGHAPEQVAGFFQRLRRGAEAQFPVGGAQVQPVAGIGLAQVGAQGHGVQRQGGPAGAAGVQGDALAQLDEGARQRRFKRHLRQPQGDGLGKPPLAGFVAHRQPHAHRQAGPGMRREVVIFAHRRVCVRRGRQRQGDDGRRLQRRIRARRRQAAVFLGGEVALEQGGGGGNAVVVAGDIFDAQAAQGRKAHRRDHLDVRRTVRLHAKAPAPRRLPAGQRQRHLAVALQDGAVFQPARGQGLERLVLVCRRAVLALFALFVRMAQAQAGAGDAVELHDQLAVLRHLHVLVRARRGLGVKRRPAGVSRRRHPDIQRRIGAAALGQGRHGAPQALRRVGGDAEGGNRQQKGGGAQGVGVPGGEQRTRPAAAQCGAQLGVLPVPVRLPEAVAGIDDRHLVAAAHRPVNQGVFFFEPAGAFRLGREAQPRQRAAGQPQAGRKGGQKRGQQPGVRHKRQALEQAGGGQGGKQEQHAAGHPGAVAQPLPEQHPAGAPQRPLQMLRLRRGAGREVLAWAGHVVSSQSGICSAARSSAWLGRGRTTAMRAPETSTSGASGRLLYMLASEAP